MKLIHRTFVLFLIPIIAVTIPAGASQTDSDILPPDLDTYIESSMKELMLPGMSIAVVKDGEPVLVKGYGVREAGKDAPVDGDTLFAIGSATKAFTSAAMGMLVDRGKVDWNTRVHEVDPELELSDPWITQEIRISDLPSNHSGLSGVSESLWYGSGFSSEEIIDRLKFVPFNEGFRYQYQYRNVMFLLAGEMIPHLAGKTWSEFMVEEIFVPLGMDRSLPTDVGLDEKDNVAAPHLIDYENEPVSVPYRAMTNIAPAGSIISSAQDLVSWLQLQLARSDADLLTPDTLRFLHTAQTPMWTISPDGVVRNSPFPLHSYCLGWVTESYEGLRLVWHNGNIDGMSAWVGLVPELGLGIAILSNLDDCELRKAVFYKIVDHVAEIDGADLEPGLVEALNARLAQRDEMEKEWQELTHSSVKPALPLGDYAGDYHSDIMGTATIRDINNRLVYSRTKEQTLELVSIEADSNDFLGRHTDPNEDLRTGKVEVSFEIEDGKVISLIDFAEGSPITFEKIQR
jgi:CubicO group peptidase (beta-lactamase class C family)